ncbi:MAG: uncharacterized protein JWP11_2100 [Frankiales bacterium]|jgi:hypothetical protein|nr:uncharacterized protein [Frankiales bacterium]
MAELWGLLADEDRLRVFAALALGARSIADLADHAGMDPRTVVKALQRLEAGGVVSGTGPEWELRRDVIAAEARRTSKTFEPYDEEGLPPRQASVLRAFLREGRLASIPSVRSKRLVVLDHIAKVFEIGVRYPEREVDALLRAFHDDYAALRRYLVDEGFLARDHAEYWRSGGSVEL